MRDGQSMTQARDPDALPAAREPHVVEVIGLTRCFGKVTAVDAVS